MPAQVVENKELKLAVNNQLVNTTDSVGELDGNELLQEFQAIAPRDPKGRFGPGNTAANKGRHSLAKKAAAFVRAKLAAIDPRDPEGRSKLELITNNLIEIAANTDPKSRKEAVWAFNSLMERAYGTPLKSDEELEAMAQGGVTFVFVAPPQIDEAAVPRALPQPQPTFDDDGYEQ